MASCSDDGYAFEEGEDLDADTEEVIELDEDDEGEDDVKYGTSPGGAASRAEVVWGRVARLEEQERTVRSVVEVLAVSEGAARLLLRKFKWNPARLQERFFEDAEALSRKYGIACYSDPVVYAGEGAEVTCEICFCPAGDSAVGIGACAHLFCLDCYGQYLAHALSDKGSEAQSTRCPSKGCGWVCDPVLFRYVMQHAQLAAPFTGKNMQLLARYNELLERSFVDDNPRCKWCPSAGCDKVIFVRNEDLLAPSRVSTTIASGEGTGSGDDGGTSAVSLFYGVSKAREADTHDVRFQMPLIVTCSCGSEFCFLCGETAHMPAKCYMLRDWTAKQESETETVNWLNAHTKPCPGCGTAIEKNEGCNSMHCKSCGFHFCWVCEKEWSKHGSEWYKCNFYEGDESADTSKREKYKQALNRYIFYFTRYSNHDNSKHLEKKIFQQAEKQMRHLQDTSNNKLYQVEYLSEAARMLIRARETLKYTYVYAFYLKEGKEKSLFEYNQAQLEHSTENLSKMLEPRRRKPDADGSPSGPDRQTTITQHMLVKRSLERLQQGVFAAESQR